MMTFKRNPQFMSALRGELAGRLMRGAGKVAERARNSMDRTGEGTKYPDLQRRSSGPGEPPVSQTGKTAAGIAARGPVISSEEIVTAVASDDFHLRFLEAGTKSMAPRPVLRPALRMGQDDVLKAIGGQS